MYEAFYCSNQLSKKKKQKIKKNKQKMIRCRSGAKKIEAAVEVKERKSKTKKERLCGEESLKILE